MFGSALLRCELAQDRARGFGSGIGCSGVIPMVTWDGRRQVRIGRIGVGTVTVMTQCYNWFSSLVKTEQRWFGGWRDLDYSTSRVQWLHTPLHGKAEVQGTRLSKPEEKGMHPIGNSRGIAAQVRMTSVRFRQGVGHLPVSVT